MGMNTLQSSRCAVLCEALAASLRKVVQRIRIESKKIWLW